MGFNPRLAPYSLTQVMDADPAAVEVFHIFRFPVAGRVIDAYATNTAAISTATNTLTLNLMQFSSAAVPLVVGTIGSWAAGSTWAVDVPRQMSMTAVGSTAQFSAGEWLRLTYTEATSGTWTEMGIQVDYILGYDV